MNPIKTISDWMHIRSYYKNSNILLSNKCAIYFFVPKAACSTLKHMCAHILGVTPQHIHDYPYPHIKKRDVVLYREYFKFTFVRNPWDRIFSLYKERIKTEPITNELFERGVMKNLAKYDGFYAGMPFEEFVEIICAIPDRNADPHFRSQYTFIADRGKKLFVDFIGKVEVLEGDFAYIAQKLGLEDTYQLKHYNKTARSEPYWNHYDKRRENLIANRYSTSIQLLDYDFKN